MSHRSATASHPALPPLEDGIHLVHSASKAFIRRPRKPTITLRLIAPGERVRRTLSLPARTLHAVAFFLRHLPAL